MNESDLSPERRRKLAGLEDAAALQDARAEHNERMYEQQKVQALVDIEMGRLKGASDSLVAQIAYLAQRLQAVLGSDYGVAGEQAQVMAAAHFDTGEPRVAIGIGGRWFTFGPKDTLLVWRDEDGEWQYAPLGSDAEAAGPWTTAKKATWSPI